MAYYQNFICFLETSTSLKDKILKYDALILAMTEAAERAALSGEIDEYALDDGQTKIRNIYRNPTDLFKAIKGIEQLRQIAVGKLCGNVMVLKDRGSLT